MNKQLAWLSLILIGLYACQRQPASIDGKSIVISAPSIYSTRLQQALEAQGGKVTSMPSIETIVYDSIPELERLNHKIKPQNSGSSTYDYIVLPSRNAIKAFDKEIRKQQTFDEWKEGKYYIIGKDKELLLSLGYKTSINLVEPSLKGIINTIKREGSSQNKKMLLVSPEVKHMKEPNIVPDFIKEIEELGIHCHRVYGYTTQAVIAPHNDSIIHQLQRGNYDVLALSSGGEAFAIAQQAPPASLKCKIACFGPYTAKSAKEAGFHVDIVSDKFHSFKDYANAIVKALDH